MGLRLEERRLGRWLGLGRLPGSSLAPAQLLGHWLELGRLRGRWPEREQLLESLLGLGRRLER